MTNGQINSFAIATRASIASVSAVCRLIKRCMFTYIFVSYYNSTWLFLFLFWKCDLYSIVV